MALGCHDLLLLGFELRAVGVSRSMNVHIICAAITCELLVVYYNLAGRVHCNEAIISLLLVLCGDGTLDGCAVLHCFVDRDEVE